jgi:hypothetical protein
MQGIFGGEKAVQALLAIDQVVNKMERREGGGRRLPKISDMKPFERRTQSIPPKTANAAAS